MRSYIESIRKRNGEVVPFDSKKIFQVLEKAFSGSNFSMQKEKIEEITKYIIETLEKKYQEGLFSVEDVQNVVEEELMKRGFFEIARSYIVYRYEHAKVRKEKKEEMVKKVEEGTLQVQKRSGRKEPFSQEKLILSLKKQLYGYEEEIDMSALVEKVKLEIYDGISVGDIEKAVIMVVRTMIEQDTLYSYIAARLVQIQTNKQLLSYDKRMFGDMEDMLRMVFVKNIKKAVGDERLDPKMLLFDLEFLAKQLQFSHDRELNYLSVQTLTDRYLNRNPHTKELYENIQMFWMRVAMGLALNEKEKNEKAVEFYEVMSKRLYIPSTPTLFHSGTTHPQMSSCYLTTIEDSLDHIFKCISDNAQLSKWSGGIGNDWTNLRGTGAIIQGTGVESQGVIPFLKIANDTTVAINRSGRRRGATCAYLETWHYDIEDFLELRKNTGDERRRTHDMNTANWIPDLFMKRIERDEEWTLFSPEETSDLHHVYGKDFEERYVQYEKKAQEGNMRLFKKVKAKDLWRKMLTMLFETGHPWITWKDPSNIRSPQDHVGVVHNSNLCTEITLNTSSSETAVCNLGSINLEEMIQNDSLNIELLEKTIQTAMRMLDNVVDLNFYPTEEAKYANFKHRPVGLGIMGFQNALYKLKIRFDSEEAVQFADESMEIISYFTILSSSLLSKERGSYGSYRGSKWDRRIFPIDTIQLLENERGEVIPVEKKGKMDWSVVFDSVKANGMRNSNCMAIAPTATISNISVTTPTIEPMYKNIYVKSNQAGDFVVVNPYLVDELKALHLWNNEMLQKIKYYDGNITNILEIPKQIREMYKEVFQIDMRWLIKIAAHRGKWVDQSQSLNMYFNGSSGKELSDIYIYAWKMGLKTTYYLRSLGVSQVEKSTVETQQFGSTHLRTSITEGVKEIPKKICKINDPDCESCQ